jgi:hypothetical protein
MRPVAVAAAGALLSILAAAPAPAQVGAGAQAPAARRADVASPDAIILAVYDVISGPIGQKRDWNRFRSLFYPGARLIPARVGSKGRATVDWWDVDRFIAVVDSQFTTLGFFEREVGRRSEAFGHILHSFSTYESRRKPTDPQPYQRGINSFQLLKDGDRWWVVNIYWDSERPGNPIPERYLVREPLPE